MRRVAMAHRAQLPEDETGDSSAQGGPPPDLRSFAELALPAFALAALLSGALAQYFGAQGASTWSYIACIGVVLVPTIIATARRLLAREMGVDLIAVLAMMGALALEEYLAGAIIAVMLTGGTALERFAVARARRELTALIRRVPRTAHRRAGANIIDTAVDEVALADVLVVKPGEVIPVDGILLSPNAVLDESSLTGESKPVRLESGAPVRSGGTNSGGPFELRPAQPTVPMPESFASYGRPRHPKHLSFGLRTATRWYFSP